MTVQIIHGDCFAAVRAMPDNSVHSLVTDPPYALGSIVKRFGAENAAPPKGNEAYMRMSAGFMGKQWDTGKVAFAVEFWTECLRVLKPGGHVLAFGGTRTYHRLACAIEDAGFEVRDMIGWLYGSGFPKSHNLDDDFDGWGTALKPAQEPIVMARKPLIGTVLENMTAHHVGAINIDGCRVEGAFVSGWSKSGSKESDNTAMSGKNYAREAKPDSAEGRWPANIIHSGDDEVLAAFPETTSGGGPKAGTPRTKVNTYGDPTVSLSEPYGSNKGSAARFFYCAKASKADRDDGCQDLTQTNDVRINAPRENEEAKFSTTRANNHPTVKPTELMRYLCRLVTPPGGTVLDPFMGSGSTGRGAVLEGFDFIGVEQDAGYVEIARARIAAVTPKIKMPWEK